VCVRVWNLGGVECVDFGDEVWYFLYVMDRIVVELFVGYVEIEFGVNCWVMVVVDGF